MKKLFTILAAALFVVACGGGNAKNEPKSLEEQFLEHLAKMEKAMEAKDWKKTSEACNAYWEWDDSLDEEQSEELDEILRSKEEYWDILGAAIDAANYGYDEICEDDEPEVHMVYSNCYDGYLNVRAAASTKSQVLGILRNGEAAELLSIEGCSTLLLSDSTRISQGSLLQIDLPVFLLSTAHYCSVIPP